MSELQKLCNKCKRDTCKCKICRGADHEANECDPDLCGIDETSTECSGFVGDSA